MNFVPKRGWIAALLILVMLSGYWIRSQRVFFPDPRLEDCIREVSERYHGQIYRWHLRQIEILDARGRNISDLRGIESMSSLRWLNLEDNQVRDVTPLSQLPRLNYLSLRNNGILSLEEIRFYTLTGLPLEGLSLRHNVVRYPDGSQRRLEDISLLSYFEELIFLELRDNHISDCVPIADLTGLVILDISQNPLEDDHGQFLKRLMNLQELNLRETGLRNISVVGALIELRCLNIHSNPDIESIAAIGNLHNLEELIMRDVPIDEEITALSELRKLYRLNIRSTGVDDLTVLGMLLSQGALQDRSESLTMASLDLRDNPIPSLSADGWDGYAPVRPYWEEIGERYPKVLPD